MSKLARERLLHLCTATATDKHEARHPSGCPPLARNSSGSITTAGEGSADSSRDDSSGATEREARLRTQAQLRARLAAAKKAAARSTEDSSTKEDGGARRGGTEDNEEVIQSQEEVLRRMLAERRRSSVVHK